MNRYVFSAKEHWPWLLGLNALICSGAAAIYLSTPQTWEADAEIIIPSETSSLNTDLGEIGTIKTESLTYSQQLNPLKIVSSILGSDTVMENVRLVDPEKDDFTRLKTYKGLFKISPQSETTVISISASASNPDLARLRLEALIYTFQERLITLRQDEANKRSAFANKELVSATQALQQARSQLANYQSGASIIDSSIQTTGIVDTLGNLTNTQAQSIAQASAEQSLANNLSAQLKLAPDQALDLLRLNENKEYQYINQKLSETEAALVEKQALFTNDHPEVQYLLQQRNQLQAQTNQFIGQIPGLQGLTKSDISVGQNASELIRQLVVAQNQAIAAEQQANQLQNTIDQLNSNLLELPRKQANLDSLQDDYEVARATYRGLTAQLQEAKLSAFGAYPVIQVLDKPAVDLKAASPNKKTIAAGTFLSCLFGTAALLLVLVNRDSLLGSEEILTAELEILGHIPKLKTSQLKAGGDTRLCFQRLASTVSLLSLKNARLLITSSEMGEGKTTITAGLAVALTTLGFKVLLVEGNFESRQLSSTLLGKLHQREPLKKIKSPKGMEAGIIPIREGLDFLTIDFFADALQLIARGGFERVLSEAQKQADYNYVLIDGGAVNIDNATPLLAKAAVNVLMVTRPGFSKQSPFRESLEYLSRYSIWLTGLVINDGQPIVRRSVGRLVEYNEHGAMDRPSAPTGSGVS